MSPEAVPLDYVQSLSLDAPIATRPAPCDKSDVWSLACVLLELFTGRVPWFGVDSAALVSRVLRGEAPPQLSGKVLSTFSAP